MRVAILNSAARASEASQHHSMFAIHSLALKRTILRQKFSTMKKITRLIVALTILFSNLQNAYAQAGLTWTSQTSAANNGWRSITYGAGLFVAVANSGVGNRVMTSPDGTTWTSRTSAADNSWNGVSYGNSLFVAVSSTGAGNRVMTSPDGITWTIRTSATNTVWRSVTYGAGLFAAVSSSGTGNRVMTSPDGITWTSRTSAADNSWTAITYDNSLFVAVSNTGTGNRVMTSPDGINWTSQSSAADLDWNSITYGNGLFVAVAGSAGANAGVMTSSDGITWTSRTAAANNQWNSVSYGNGLFAAVSTTGIGDLVMTSPDGINWTSRIAAALNNWVSIIYSNSLFVAVSVSGTGNRVMSSGAFVILPLRWLSINGNLNSAKQAAISWRVTEQNVSSYKVEKSNDGINYNSIGSINSKGAGNNNYTFTEMQTLTGTAYYRVKQTDIDGKFTYSPVITLRNNHGQQVSIYPNPAKELITVTVGNNLLNKNAMLTDMYGKVLQIIKISSLSFTLNLSGYPAGFYVMKIDNEKQIKIIKE